MCVTVVFAQRRQQRDGLVDVCGEATIELLRNMTIEQAEQMALERAKFKALADAFGTSMSQENITQITNQNDRSDTWFRMYGGSEVKGDWIEYTKKPEYKETTDPKTKIKFLTATVCGKAREIVGAGIEVTAKVLRNGTEDIFESSEFRNNDDIYLSFRSPVDGFLAVYLIDDNEMAYCLLPYERDRTGKVSIEAGKDYVFFSRKHVDKEEASRVDEYQLYCDKPVEYNRMFIIFSPNEFIKANDRQSAAELIPRELPYNAFHSWLSTNRRNDVDMRVDTKTITIKK